MFRARGSGLWILAESRPQFAVGHLGLKLSKFSKFGSCYLGPRTNPASVLPKGPDFGELPTREFNVRTSSPEHPASLSSQARSWESFKGLGLRGLGVWGLGCRVQGFRVSV